MRPHVCCKEGVWARSRGEMNDGCPPRGPGHGEILGMVYNQSRKRVVLFGGDDAPPEGSTTSPMADLWGWDGTGGVWTNRRPATLPVAGWPSARSDPALVYDPTRARTLFFGDQTISQESGSGTGALAPGSIARRTPSPPSAGQRAGQTRR